MGSGQEEDISRIVNCMSSCWPEYPFTYVDIRKPSSEKFKNVLSKFLIGFVLGGNYQLPGVHYSCRNPEMYAHMEDSVSLYLEINCILKGCGINYFRHGDLIRPTTNIVRETLLALVNLLAYFEGEDANLEEVEAEVKNLKHQTIQNEKRLVEEERYLDQCRQSVEEKKIMETDLRRHLVNRKEKYLRIEAVVTKWEREVEDVTKKVKSATLKLENCAKTLEQAEMEKEKAAEAVVPDPEALEAELRKTSEDKETKEAVFKCLNSRIPVLEQQIQDRKLLLQDQKETQQPLEQLKEQISKIKGEWEKTESEFRRVDEEKQNLENQSKKKMSLVESKKRMLEELIQKVEQFRGQTEKARSDIKQRMSEDDSRKAQMEARVLCMDNEIAQLKQEVNSGQKALDEGVAVLEAIHFKLQRGLEQLDLKYENNYQEGQKMISNFLDEKFNFKKM